MSNTSPSPNSASGSPMGSPSGSPSGSASASRPESQGQFSSQGQQKEGKKLSRSKKQCDEADLQAVADLQSQMLQSIKQNRNELVENLQRSANEQASIHHQMDANLQHSAKKQENLYDRIDAVHKSSHRSELAQFNSLTTLFAGKRGHSSDADTPQRTKRPRLANDGSFPTWEQLPFPSNNDEMEIDEMEIDETCVNKDSPQHLASAVKEIEESAVQSAQLVGDIRKNVDMSNKLLGVMHAKEAESGKILESVRSEKDILFDSIRDEKKSAKDEISQLARSFRAEKENFEQESEQLLERLREAVANEEDRKNAEAESASAKLLAKVGAGLTEVRKRCTGLESKFERKFAELANATTRVLQNQVPTNVSNEFSGIQQSLTDIRQEFGLRCSYITEEAKKEFESQRQKLASHSVQLAELKEKFNNLPFPSA